MAKTEESNVLTITIKQAIEAVILAIKAKKVAMLHGSPAIGKSAIVQQIADMFNLKLIDMRLSQCDPTDLSGFPYFNVETGRATYMPLDTFPIEGDDLPIHPVTKKQYSGWLLFFDEFNSATPAVQAASYKILLDRMVGKHSLHKNVAIVCAGNLETDGAIVEPMSTALQSRLIHLNVVVDALDWILWASQKKKDFRITSFISQMPGLLYTFKPDHTDKTYSSPRTWDFANDLLEVMDLKDPSATALLSGCLGQGVAREFMMFCDIFTRLPTIADILMAPDQIRVPNEPSILFAMCGALSHHARPSNMDTLMRYISRLPIEFQVVCMRLTLNRNTEFVNVPAVQIWVGKNAVEMY